MKREDAWVLLEHFATELTAPGTTTAPYHGYNSWTAYIVKDSPHAYDSVHEWETPGLFIGYDELEQVLRRVARPYATIFYKMGCGKVLVLVIPTANIYKLPNNLTVLKRGGVFKGESGFWVAIEHWHEVGNMNDFVIRKGDKRRSHLVKKVPRSAPKRS